MAFEGESGGSTTLPKKYTAPVGPGSTPNPGGSGPAAPHGGGSSSGLGTLGTSGTEGHYNTPTFPGAEGVLATDWGYQQLLSLDKAMSMEDLARMNRNIGQMTAYYGSDQDPLSLLGRIFTAYGDRNRTIGNTLAGHGMLGSGETKFQADKSTLAYQQQEYDAKFKLQQYIQGLNDAFKDAERQRKINEMTAGENAINSWIQNNPPIWIPGDPGDPYDPNNPGYVPPTLGVAPVPLPVPGPSGQGSYYPVGGSWFQ